MAGFINVPLLSTFNDAGIRKAQAQLGGISTAISGIGRSVIAATAGFASLNAAIDFIGSSLTQARDAERNFAALGSVFGDLAPQMQQFANDANSIGLSNVDAAKASTFLGSVLKQAGFDMDTVASQTQNLVGLASDLAITYGYDVSEALTGMTALFRGEYDPIEKFGVAMKQSEVNAVLAANGQDKLTGAARRNAEQIARLALLMDRTKDAQGAYARGAGTLFVEQTNLATAMADMKQALGEQLIPAFAAVAQKMVPIVTSLGPALGEIFKQIGVTIGILAPYLPKIASMLANVAGFANELLKVMNFLLPLIIDNAGAIVAMIAAYKSISAVTPIIQGLRVQLALAKLELRNGATMATLFGTAVKGAGISSGGLIAGAAVAAVGLSALAVEAHKANMELEGTKEALDLAAKSATIGGPVIGMGRAMQGGLKTLREQALVQKGLDAWAKSWQARGAAATAKKETDPLTAFEKMLKDVLDKFSGATSSLDKEGSKATKAATDYVKKFYAGLREETAKQRVRLQLEGKTSKGVIDYILGSDNWMTVWMSIKKNLDVNLKSIESQFKNTAAGVAEMAAAEKEAADKAQELADKLKAVKADLNAAADGFRSIGKDNSLPQFEGEVVSALTSIEDALKKAFDAGDITRSAFDDLRNYATKESSVLRNIAKQRDELAKKKSLVESILSNVKSSFYGAANITSKLESVTSTVTETTVKMIDGLKVTTTSTAEITKQTGSVVDNFKTLVDRTKTFVAALKQLKAQGLNAELFQQIVDAGIESGAATAEGILAGGPKAISEVNSLFEELRLTTGDAVDTTAAVMLAAGKDVTSSLLDGIKAEEYRLQELAASMAMSFADAFAAAIELALSNIKLPVASGLAMGLNANGFAYSSNPLYGGTAESQFGSGTPWAQAVSNYAKNNPTNVTVNVNAGLVSSPAQVGAEINTALNAYKRANGEI